MLRPLSVLVAALMLLPSSIPADDGAGGSPSPAICWEVFVNHLRAGRMAEAYGRFSPLSREVFPYREFLQHYNPLTASSEAILSPVSNGQLRMSGDLASFRFLAMPGSGDASRPVASTDDSRKAPASVYVTALMVREGDGWHLVAARREAAARLEAETRNLLRRLWREPAIRMALEKEEAHGAEDLARAAPALLQTADAALCLQQYALSSQATPAGIVLVATPSSPALRAFCIGEGDTVTQWRGAPDTKTASAPRTKARSALQTPDLPPLPSREIASVSKPPEPPQVLPSVPPAPPPPSAALPIPAGARRFWKESQGEDIPPLKAPHIRETPAAPPPDLGDPAAGRGDGKDSAAPKSSAPAETLPDLSTLTGGPVSPGEESP